MSSILKIGMIAPSKAGKTSLLAAIFQAMKDKLAGNSSNIQYAAADDATRMKIQRAIAEFRTATASEDGIFEVPRLQGTQEMSHYQFGISIGVERGKRRIGIDIMDYPGGYLGMEDFAKITEYLNECIAMLVPIPSEILMEWKRTKGVNNRLALRKNILAQEMLCIDDTRSAIVDWAKRRAKNQQKSILIFVPIKCEAYFDDNGGNRDESILLHKAVKELYVNELLTNDLTPEEKEHVQIETFAVDTYGIVELRDVELHRENGSDYLVSTFKRRLHCGRNISIKGALEILAAIMSFYLEKVSVDLDGEVYNLETIINDRNFFTRIRYRFFGEDKEQAQLVDFQRQIEIIHDVLEIISDIQDVSEKRHKIHNTVEW